ncbi:aspartyl/asparaginyl beta-hydroxylase domain-containing protein [Frankia sp. AgB1.8]|nr:aspartyl/asparaginyl beta-hydroxylase domain-containing protein [Frankia sp. AgB1.8]
MANSRPTAVRLRLTFEAARLLADYGVLMARTWPPKGSYAAPVDNADRGWHCLPLRSPGGRPERTDPGGPGLDSFADCPVLAEVPYLREVLAGLPMPLRSARLISLLPGCVVKAHSDAPLGLDYGMVRLHIPITTNPAVGITIGGERHRWGIGELWYGDFGQDHSAVNEGDTRRVHLVIDAEVTPGLVELFPFDALGALAPEGILFSRPPARFDAAAFMPWGTSVPAAFFDWGAPLEERADSPDHPAAVYAEGKALRLRTANGATYGLVHIGDLEFRIKGWIAERTLQLHPTGEHPWVRFAAHRGTSSTILLRDLLAT